MTRPVNISRILAGPHIKRMIDQPGSAPLVEIEALAFHGLTRQRTSEPWRISSRAIR